MLATLDDYLAATGVAPGDVEPTEEDQITFALAAASQAVASHVGTKFELATGAFTPREFMYDGLGFIEIDDAVAVSTVEMIGHDNVARALTVDEEWWAQPFEGPVKYYIEVAPGYGIGSPEMGFKRNLDRIGLRPWRPMKMRVTADWGWEEVPYSVRQAVIWTANAAVKNPGVYSQESIEGYSRSNRFMTPDAIPERALALLVGFERIKV